MHWLLKILCWILAEIEIMRIHTINTFSYCTVAKACFRLNLLSIEVSSLKEVWFFFKIFLNQNMFPKGVILHRNSIENFNMGGGSFMISSNKGYKLSLWIFMSFFILVVSSTTSAWRWEQKGVVLFLNFKLYHVDKMMDTY